MENSLAQETQSVNRDQGHSNLAFSEDVTGDSPAASGNIELGKKAKVPRRIIHFVNGDTLEEYSTDEEEEEDKPAPVDPTSLTWLPWFWFWIVICATKSLAAADFLGEKLAWLFGITSPKYQSIIDEYYKLKEEEEEEQRLEREENEKQLHEIKSEVTSNSADNPDKVTFRPEAVDTDKIHINDPDPSAANY